jgi:protein-S-isoprenylcysteine O-methyltransferase Ste14
VFYLAVALVWLTLGLILIIYPEWMPAGLHRIPGTEISFGWVCIFFFAWRMLGWWQWRAKQRRRVLEPAPPVRRERASDQYHPEFDFNEPPSAESK